ncbi:MAG: prepilin-type N-terminal cleavage/methylation domain-containing protein [Nitrospirae bacterium]|nr:prepilin-type N-terminal cleavage/methylation domain-containing protein [Nitrospirota bacterium]
MRLRSIRSSALLRSNGFSLMEVMVALAIMAVAVVAMFQLYSRALRSTKQAEDYTRAIFYGRSMLDEAYSVPDPSEISGSKEYEKYYTVTRQAVIRSESEDTKAKLYEIMVTVTWPPSGNLTMKGLRSVYAPEE